jgi:hypothetical protein
VGVNRTRFIAHRLTGYIDDYESNASSLCPDRPRSAGRVIFRRGPSKQVLLIKWDLAQDTFEYGQWLKGRIYERRCDLSPEGDLLLYFAADWRKPYQSWIAISRPPFLSALALWPKGDGWGGGGHFIKRNRILLNHRDGEIALAEVLSVPKWLNVGQFGDRPGWGEDDPVWSARLKRDGWKLTGWPEKTKDEYGAKVGLEYDPPITWRKVHPAHPNKYVLQMSILGMNERNGAWYLIDHAVIDNDGDTQSIGRSEWADWSPNGDLLFSQSGCLYRLRCGNGVLGQIESSEEIADFSSLEFEGKESCAEAREWPLRRPKTRKR